MQDIEEAHHRRSIRLRGYDYTAPGAYFVTLVTNQRILLFGDIVNGIMNLNDYGIIAQEEWFKAITLRPYLNLDEDGLIVMPNHVHGIVWINESDDIHGRGAATLRPYSKPKKECKATVDPRSLGSIIRSYKSAVSYRINQLRSTPGSAIWQRNYYEHIVRDEMELEGIGKYIITNPVNWENDPEYKL